MSIRILSAASSSTDPVTIGAELIEQIDANYLVYSYLGDRELGRLSCLRAEDGSGGFVRSFLAALGRLSPALFLNPQLRIISDAAAANPTACAERIARLLCDTGNAEVVVGVLKGGEIADRIEEFLNAGCDLRSATDGTPLVEEKRPILGAFVDAGARPIADALLHGAQIVLGSSIAPASYGLAPVLAELPAEFGTHERQAAVAIGGTLLSQGARLCWNSDISMSLPLPVQTFTPSLLVEKNGRVELQIRPAQGGKLSLESIRRVLDLQDSKLAVASPDISTAWHWPAAEEGDDQSMAISGCTDIHLSEDLPVSIWLHAGYRCELWWIELEGRGNSSAERIADWLQRKVPQAGLHVAERSISHPSVEGLEVRHETPEAIELCVREMSSLQRLGLKGISFLPFQKPRVEPCVHRWETRVPRGMVDFATDCRPALEWV